MTNMPPRQYGFSRTAQIVAGVALAASLTACANGRDRNRKVDTQYVARDVSTLYNAGKQRLDQGNFRLAAALFDEVERQHPYSEWARRAQLMSAFSYYAGGEYTKSIDSARRFIQTHPGNKDAPYAYYLIGMSYYEQISDTTHDQKITEQALSAFGQLIRLYPESTYATDARLKIDLINDHLAGKEMEIGRLYQRRGRWIAATIRFQNVVDTYQTTTHVPEALYRLTECYLALGLPEEAKKSASVLGANYPGSDWYKRAYGLMEKKGGGVN